MSSFTPRCPPPTGLIRPVPIDPTGVSGPTPGQARGPRWRRTTPRLYVPASVELTVEQRILEQSLRLPDGGAVAAWAALRLAGGRYFDGVEPGTDAPRPVPLMVPRGRNLRPLDGGQVIREQLAPAELTTLHGIACVEATRSTFDAARRAAGLREAVVVVDMALAAGLVTLSDLTSYTESHSGRWRAQQALFAALLADARSLSPEETRLRLVWRMDAQLPSILSNWPVADLDGRRLGRPDLLCPSLGVAGEYDGAEHRSRARQAVDAAREEAFRNAGLECFRVVGADRMNTRLVVDRMLSACERARTSRLPRRWVLARNPGPP